MSDQDKRAYPQGLRTWIDGTLYADPADALVPATDHGLVAGDGVFEVLRVSEQGAFATTRHLARLARSAAKMGLPAPDEDFVRQGIDAICGDLASWPEPNGRLRITYTGGLGPLASYRTGDQPMIVISAEPTKPSGDTDCIVTLPWTRNLHGAMTGVKSTSYGENVRALAYARERGCNEGIFINTDGNVAEGTGTNVFCVFDGVVTTPPLSAGVLDGITRALVLEWFDGCVERDFTLEEALTADEVFLTSTTRDVQAQTAWDDTTFDAPGPIASRMRTEFQRRAAESPDPGEAGGDWSIRFGTARRLGL